jgi:hypothetical protein
MNATRQCLLTLVGMISLATSAFAEPAFEGSWYDEVGEEKGIARVSGFSDASAEATMLSGLEPSSSACQMNVLKQLGWQIEFVPGAQRVTYVGGNPCDNSSLAESQSHGELRIQVPQTIDEATLSTVLRQILVSQASVCAYKFRVGNAAIRTSRWLQANDGFYFYAGGWPFIEFTRGDLWWGSCSGSSGYSCFYPRTTNVASMNEFTRGKIGADCAVGLQAAEYQQLREVFGDDAFNSEFRPKEITLAPWAVLNTSQSATWGNMTTADTTSDRDAVMTSRLGSRAFSGFSGYIGNVFGEGSLDNPVDRGENFLTVSVSLTAGAELAARGGFGDFNRLNRRIYELGRYLSPQLEQLALTRRDPSTIGGITESQRQMFAEMQSILANPVYSGYQVWVHPLGIQSLGKHVVRLLERNPRTPYTFQL